MREIGSARLTREVASLPEGRAGGIMILWNEFEVQTAKGIRHIGRGVVSLSFRSIKNDFMWNSIRVYGPQSREEKKALWNDMFMHHFSSGILNV